VNLSETFFVNPVIPPELKMFGKKVKTFSNRIWYLMTASTRILKTAACLGSTVNYIGLDTESLSLQNRQELLFT